MERGKFRKVWTLIMEMTYKQFKAQNEKVKRTKNYTPVTIIAVNTSPKSVQMDNVVLSTNQSLKVQSLVNSVALGIFVVTNPSKLTNWRGFIK